MFAKFSKHKKSLDVTIINRGYYFGYNNLRLKAFSYVELR